MQIVLVPIACRSVGEKEGLTQKELSCIMHVTWNAIMPIQRSPTLVKLLDMRTPEVIPL